MAQTANGRMGPYRGRDPKVRAGVEHFGHLNDGLFAVLKHRHLDICTVTGTHEGLRPLHSVFYITHSLQNGQSWWGR